MTFDIDSYTGPMLRCPRCGAEVARVEANDYDPDLRVELSSLAVDQAIEIGVLEAVERGDDCGPITTWEM